MAAKLKSIGKYGCRWAGDLDPLEIEMYAIRQGGYWTTKDGIKHGEGLIAHYLAARSLLWPKRYRHRWTDLIYKTVLENQIAILVGPASSQKTSHLSEIVLISYFAFPHDTAVLVSTTSVDKLDSSVFGEIKMLWKDAKELRDTIPGHMIDYRHAIVTDDAKEGARDMRRGVQGKALYVGAKYVGLANFAGIKQNRFWFLADELQYCFVAGTMVDTLSGLKAIESIREGDYVYSAAGPKPVTKTINHLTDELVVVKTIDGRSITCTKDHPFFTNQGWVKACQLNRQHYILSPYEALSILRGGFCFGEGEPEALRLLPHSAHNPVRIVQGAFQTTAFTQRGSAFLQSILLGEMETQPARDSSEDVSSRNRQKAFALQKEMARGPSRVCETTVATHEKVQSHAYLRSLSAGSGQHTIGWMPTASARREWVSAYQSREGFAECCAQFNIQLSSQNTQGALQRVSWTLQSGRSTPENQTGNRSGWSIPQQPDPAWMGQKKGIPAQGAWVDCVEVYEQRSATNDREGDRYHHVYNLEVEGHPSYSVNGLLVHNCPSTFLDCIPNMRSNTGAGGLHVLGSGNPNHDTESQLGVVAEPPEGWASVEGNEQTSVWPIKLSGGVCLNLIGTDSPNFDGPEDEDDKYPRLIGRAFERIIAHDYGANSPTYETQVKGRMKLSLAHSRVITRQLCRDHHAHDRALWEGVNRTRVYATDPAYGGGDRCVTGWGEFGRSDTGKIIFRVNPPRIIKINVKAKLSPEDQISEAVFNDLKELQIQPDHAGYDSFGKGTIGFALARKFGADCPVPIDAGAQPTKRPVRAGLFIQDEQRHERRLKQCSEHYAKFITEMWFSVRYMIEAEQMRELPMDVMSEGCWREYKTVAGDKIEVEPKDKMKERTGKSPDLFDWLAVLVEMARRCGFLIDKLGEPTDSGDDEGYFESEAREYQQAIRGHLLQHR